MVNTVITKGFKTTCFAAAAFTAFATFQVNADIVYPEHVLCTQRHQKT